MGRFFKEHVDWTIDMWVSAMTRPDPSDDRSMYLHRIQIYAIENDVRERLDKTIEPMLLFVSDDPDYVTQIGETMKLIFDGKPILMPDDCLPGGLT